MITVKQPVQRREFDENIIQYHANYKTNDDREKKYSSLRESGIKEYCANDYEWDYVYYVYWVGKFNEPS